MDSRTEGYALALLSSLSYSAWLISSGAVASTGGIVGSLAYAMIVALASSVLMGARELPTISRRRFLVSMVGGFAFAAGNLLFYALIPESGIGIAGAFSSLNLLFFSLMVMRRSRPRSVPAYVGGSVIAVLGLGTMYAAGGASVDAPSVAMGTAVGLLYALGTYALYRVSETEGASASAIGVFAGEVLFLLAPLSLRPELRPSVPATVAGFSLSVALALEAKGFGALGAIGGGGEALVNALSNLELLPLALYYVVMRLGNYLVYASSIAVIVAGLILMSEGMAAGSR
ncbi:MAG: hypothetical protein ACP5ID_03270 [Conexivisphaera sp.]